MRIVLFLSIFISAIVAKRSKCHSCFMGICYLRIELFGPNNAQITGQLAIDREDNILYFHSVENEEDYTRACDLNNDITYQIPGVTFSFARAVDSKGDVYMSGTKGIYKYTKSSNTTMLHGLPDSTIWHMQYSDKLYYNLHSQTGLSVLEKKPVEIPLLKTSKIEDFVIDKYGDIYFLSNNSVYRLKSDGKNVDKLVEQIYTFATDRNGNVYFAHTATSGVFKLDYTTDRIISVGAFGGNGGTPLKFAFDNMNNVVYLDKDQGLYLLLPTYRGCKVSSNSTGKKRMLSVTATGAWLEP